MSHDSIAKTIFPGFQWKIQNILYFKKNNRLIQNNFSKLFSGKWTVLSINIMGKKYVEWKLSLWFIKHILRSLKASLRRMKAGLRRLTLLWLTLGGVIVNKWSGDPGQTLGYASFRSLNEPATHVSSLTFCLFLREFESLLSWMKSFSWKCYSQIRGSSSAPGFQYFRGTSAIHWARLTGSFT